MNILRQGDVLLVRVDALPKQAKEIPAEKGRVILAHGEVTGHAHAIAVAESVTAKLWSADAERFLQIMEAATLRHEEHAPVNVPPGVYRVAIQREYTPAELRRVAD